MREKEDEELRWLLAKFAEAGVSNPWDLISDEAKRRLAFRRFMVKVMQPVEQL